MKKITSQISRIGTAVGLSLIPFLASAQITGNINNVDDAVRRFGVIGSAALSILITIGVIWIVINVVRYLIVGAGDPEKRKTAGQSILWGVVGLFVILSIWGLVSILTRTFGTNTNAPTDRFPELPINQPYRIN